MTDEFRMTIERRCADGAWEGLGDGRARLTNPWKNGNLEFEPTTGELVLKGLGGTPLREAQLRDVSQITRRAERQAREKTRPFLNRIVSAILFEKGDRQRQVINKAITDANKAGVPLTREQINRAVQDAERTRAERLVRQTRRRNRPEVARMLQGVQ